jgi:phytoene dehydrogenase-like protein
MEHRQQPEILVIGAGMGGLASAALLARAGRRVRIVESAQHAGGRARSRVQDGFVLNVGAHALARGGPAQQVLRELGVPLSGGVVAARGAYGLIEGQLHELPFGPLSLPRTQLLSWSEKLRFLRIVAGLGERAARAASGLTVNEWLAEVTPPGRVRAVLDMLLRLSCYAYAPDVFSAQLAVRACAAQPTQRLGWPAALAVTCGDQLELRSPSPP